MQNCSKLSVFNLQSQPKSLIKLIWFCRTFSHKRSIFDDGVKKWAIKSNLNFIGLFLLTWPSHKLAFKMPFWSETVFIEPKDQLSIFIDYSSWNFKIIFIFKDNIYFLYKSYTWLNNLLQMVPAKNSVMSLTVCHQVTGQEMPNRYEPQHDKTNKMRVRPAKTQSAWEWRNRWSFATHWAHREDSDQTGRMSCHGSYAQWQNFLFAMKNLAYSWNLSLNDA